MATESLLLSIAQRMEEIAGIFAPKGVNALIYWLALLLIFVIVYNALLMTGKLFGQKKHSAMRLIISFAVAYISTMSPVVVLVIERTFPALSIFLIGATALIFTLYFIFPGSVATNFLSSNLMRLIVFGAILLIFWVGLTGGASVIEPRSGGVYVAGLFLSDYDIALVLLVGGFLLLIAWAFKGDSGPISTPDTKEMLKWLFKGGLE